MATPSSLPKMGEWEMKCKFNKIMGLFFTRSQRFDVSSLRAYLARRGVTILELARFSPKTAKGRESVKEAWLDNAGLELAQVHYYELPGGEFGGTGRRLPDPLVLRWKGIYY